MRLKIKILEELFLVDYSIGDNEENYSLIQHS